MVLDSKGVPFASVAPTLREETSNQFNNSYSALPGEPSEILFEAAARHKHTHTQMCTNAHSYVRTGVRSAARPQLYTSEIIIALTNLQVHLEKKKTNSAVCALTCLVEEKLHC